MDVESRATIDEGVDRLAKAGDELLSHATADIPFALEAVVEQLDKVLKDRIDQFAAVTRAEGDHLVESIRGLFPLTVGTAPKP
jgi:hypothetical protein